MNRSEIVFHIDDYRVFAIEPNPRDGDGEVTLSRFGDGLLMTVFSEQYASKFRALTDREWELFRAVEQKARAKRNWIMIYRNKASLGSDEAFLAKVRGEEVQNESTKKQSEPQEQHTQRQSLVPQVPDHNIYNFFRLTLNPSVKRQIEQGLKKIELRDFLNNTWNLKSIESRTDRSAMNFYGPPGTGKTAAALAIGAQLNKPVLKVDYAEAVSKYVGDTGKNIKAAFTDAKKHGAILFFDEADALLSGRTSEGSALSQAMNSDKSILLQEMDAFNGIVIFTTNFFGNYDEAAVRRIAAHVEFTLPEESMMKDIYEAHIPAEVPRRKIDWATIAKASVGLSGGDVKNVCINAIVAAAMLPEKQRKLTQELLMNELDAVKRAKGMGKVTKEIRLV